DPVVELEVLLLPVVELVLETGCTERHRLAEERQVAEIRPRLLQVDVAAHAMPRDARQTRVELANALQIGRREGRVGPGAVPRFDVAVPSTVGAPEDEAQRRPRGLVDVDEHEQRSSLAHGQSYPSRWLSGPTTPAIVRRSRARSVGCHDRSSLI